MKLDGFDPSATDAWQALERSAQTLANTSIAGLFASEPGRADRFALDCAGISLDYSKNLLDQQSLDQLHPYKLLLREQSRATHSSCLFVPVQFLFQTHFP